MAFTWLEKNQTKVTSNQWGEDIYGLKATNVFGLAWNYYLGYTKFITGLDMTLDMGYKIEFFYANTFKVGYAKETNFNSNTKTSANDKVTEFHTAVSSAYGSVQSIITEALAQITTRTENVEEENSIVGEGIHNYNVLTQVIDDGLAVNVGGTLSETSGIRSMDASEVNINAGTTNVLGVVNLGD
jgi:hypothetical protein